METLQKLNFICIGAHQAGMNLLHKSLSRHPRIYLPKPINTDFFDVNEHFQKGKMYYFRAFFQNYNKEELVGSIEPNIQLDTRNLQRIIKEFGREVKILFVIRDPVRRAFAHYQDSRRGGVENLSFLEAVKNEPSWHKNPWPHRDYLTEEIGHYEKNNLGYIHRSKYLETVKFLYENFAPGNIKVILYEDLVSNEKGTMHAVLDFLNLPKAPGMFSQTSVMLRIRQFKSLLRNTGGFSRELVYQLLYKNWSMSEEEGTYVYYTYFKKEIDELEALLDISLDHWKRNYQGKL